MTVGDFAVETWRDGDAQKRLKPLAVPVWEIMAWGSPVVLRRVGDGATAITGPDDLRLATADELATARA